MEEHRVVRHEVAGALLELTVGDIVRQHWRTYGRNYYSRYDYETVDSSAAQQMVQSSTSPRATT